MATVPHHWTWPEIRDNWLTGGEITMLSEAIVDGFNRVGSVFGDAWIQSRQSRGSGPTLSIAVLGQQLQLLNGAKNREAFITRLRDGDDAAFSELRALHLIANGATGLEIELAPEAGSKVPDFRLRRNQARWVWVEVSKPDASDEVASLRTAIGRIAGEVLERVADGAALELFFLREPDRGDIGRIEQAAVDLSTQTGTVSVEVGDVALVFRSQHPPGEMVVDSHGIADSRPRLGAARMRSQSRDGAVVTLAHVSVRMPVTDQRAAGLFSREAQQLPADECGAVVLDLADTPAASAGWADLIQVQLEKYGHTRVAAAILFFHTTQLAREGSALASKYEHRLIENSRAVHALPDWFREPLRRR